MIALVSKTNRNFRSQQLELVLEYQTYLNFCQKIYYLSCRYEYKELKKEIEEFINTRLNNNSFPTEKNVKNNENYQTSQVDQAKEGIISKNFEIIINTAFFFLNLMGLAILNHISNYLKATKKIIYYHLHLLFQ